MGEGEGAAEEGRVEERMAQRFSDPVGV